MILGVIEKTNLYFGAKSDKKVKIWYFQKLKASIYDNAIKV